MPTTESALPKVYSFDVFDTCITRTFAYPKDLFYELGLRLAPKEISERQRAGFAKRFQSQRLRAEKIAQRHVHPRQTVTIEDVYQHLRLPHGLSVELRGVMEAEITLERESIYPIPAMISHIRNLRRAAHRILFISDMYLSSAVLRPILMDCGVMEEGDRLYVSCDIGFSKHRGQLFHYVLQAESLDAAQLIHSGDNLHADIRMASHAQIIARHINVGVLTARECRMADRSATVDPEYSFLAGLARRLRVADIKEPNCDSEACEHILYGIVIPFLLAYVIWVLDHARRNGIRRLYFVARDGEILYRIARALHGESANIELRYLYGSRQAWVPASITGVSNESDNTRDRPGQSSGVITRFDLLSSAGLAANEYEAIRERLGLSDEQWHAPVDRDTATKFLGAVSEDNHVPFYSFRAPQGAATLAYLRQEGLFDTRRWALVDVGWKLNCQAAIARILDFAGDSKQKPCGFYIALCGNHMDSQITGPAHAFVQQAGSIFYHRGGVIEKLFTPSTHATTHGYRQRNNVIEPVFGPDLRGAAEMAYTKRLHAAAVSAAAAIARDPCALDSIRRYSPQIISNAVHFLRYPDPTDVSQVASFRVDIDPRHEYRLVRRLCKKLSISDIWNVIRSHLQQRAVSKQDSPIWIEGSIALSPWYIRYPMRILLRIVEALPPSRRQLP
ncbi:MAG: hypothetical protein L0H73_15990 [Nitrococcus sp.]|nr:hypothetical protein [Nitrococcus sp.]